MAAVKTVSPTISIRRWPHKSPMVPNTVVPAANPRNGAETAHDKVAFEVPRLSAMSESEAPMMVMVEPNTTCPANNVTSSRQA